MKIIEIIEKLVKDIKKVRKPENNNDKKPVKLS